MVISEKLWSTGKTLILSCPTLTWITSLNSWKSQMDPKRRLLCGTYRRVSDLHLTVALPLRAVFVRNDAGMFLRKLDERVKYYDNEIEKLCNFQYQSFVKAFHELLQVRKDTTSMKVSSIEQTQRILDAFSSSIEWISEEQSNDASSRTESSEEDRNSDQGIPSAEQYTTNDRSSFSSVSR